MEKANKLLIDEGQTKAVIEECVEISHQQKALFLIRHKIFNVYELIPLNRRLGIKERMMKHCKELQENIKQNIGQLQFGEQNHNCQTSGSIKERPIVQQQDQTFNELFNLIEQFLSYFGTEKTQEIIEDFKRFKPVNYLQYDFQSPVQFKIFIKCIKYFPQYNTYQKYMGKNIDVIQRNFESQLFSRLEKQKNLFTQQNIQFIGQNFISNPQWCFMNENSLSNNQKQQIFQIICSEELIGKYALTSIIPISHLKQVNTFISKVLDFLISQRYINPRDHVQAINALTEYNAQKLFKIQSIRNYRVNIYNFIKQLGYQNYFYFKQLKFNNCLQTLSYHFRQAIRKKLHQLKIPFDLYQRIEDELLQLKPLNLFEIPLKKHDRQEIIRFFKNFKDLVNYKVVKQKLIPLQIQARIQLEQLLLQSDHLKYEQIKQIISQTIQKGALPSGYFSPRQYTNLTESYEKSRHIKTFLQQGKNQYQLTKQYCFDELVYIFAQTPNQLMFCTIEKTINDFIKSNDISAIMDSPELNVKQKQFIYNQIKSNDQCKKYQQAYQKKAMFECLKKFQDLLDYHFRNTGMKAYIIKYYIFYGGIQVQQKNVLLKPFQNNILERTLRMESAKIRQIQQSSEYKQFKKNYAGILNNERKKIVTSLESDVQNLCQCNKINGFDIEMFRSHQYDISVIPPLVTDQLRIKTSYRQSEMLKEANKYNNRIIIRQEYSKMLQNLKSHQILQKYQKKQRQQLIEGLISQGIGFLNDTSLIRDFQKQTLKAEIIESAQYRLYQESGEIVQKNKVITIQEVSEQIRKLISNVLPDISNLNSQHMIKLSLLNPLSDQGKDQLFKALNLNLDLKSKRQLKKSLDSLKQAMDPLLQQIKEHKVPEKSNSSDTIPQSPTKLVQKVAPTKEIKTSPSPSTKFISQSQSPQKVQIKTNNKNVKDISMKIQPYKNLLTSFEIKVADEIVEKLLKINPYTNQNEYIQASGVTGLAPKRKLAKFLKEKKDEIEKYYQ